MNRPLEGVRIVAVEHYGAGPFGTMYLADLGADVIKIENPKAGGDMSRHVAPFLLGEADSEFFQTLNRNKRSLTLDLKAESGQTILRRLIESADGLINNLRGDQPGKLGLTYEALKDANPRIVCAHLSAYGREGSRATWPGYDYLMQGEAGFMALTGEPDGPPTRMGLSIVDWMTGITTMLGMVSAILAAGRSGQGADIDVCLFDTALHQMSYPATWYLNEGFVTERVPRSGHPSLVPSQLYTAKDGWVYIMGLTDKFWRNLLDGVGRPDIGDNPEFADFSARLKNRDRLTETLDPVFAEKTVAEWMDIFGGRIPVGPVYDLAAALDSPYLAEREMIQTVSHPVRGDFRLLANPIKIDGERMPGEAAPQLGADTDAILRELGIAQSEIDSLRADGVI